MKSFRSFVLAPLADQLTLLGKQIMTSLADVQNELTTVTSKLTDALARVTAHEQAEDATNAALQTQVTTLTAANADLQSQIDALKAQGVDTTALDAIMTTLKGVETSIDGIDAGPAAPPAAPSGESPVP